MSAIPDRAMYIIRALIVNDDTRGNWRCRRRGSGRICTPHRKDKAYRHVESAVEKKH